jgi:GrpB-like predicted nucleotidyltransferase (UPF0157 family)/GNAT superfamily N-acetyltransferase
MIKKQIKVVEYNVEWPKFFEEAAAIIRNALGDNCVSVHHIGSTSVPGLAAKPRIDIITEAYDCNKSIGQLEAVGYQYKGEWNIPFKYGFTKRDGVEINLHLYGEGHPEVESNLRFRDYLRHNQSARDEYQQLKYKLLSDQDSYYKPNNSLFTGYNLGKDPFIRKIIEASGFDKLRFLYCSSRNEWQEYHRIKVEEIFSRLPNIVYDYNHPDLINENHYHFILCKAATVVSVGHMEDLGHGKWALRALATDSKQQGNGYGKAMLENLEKWCKLRGGSIIHVHSAPEAETFYRKLGYIDTPWDDRSIDENAIDLAKQI